VRWTRDVLQRFLAQIDKRLFNPITRVFVGCARKDYSARLANSFQPSGNIDAVAHKIAVGFLDHVTDMNADAELKPSVLRQSGIALNQPILHFDCATHRVDHASKFDDRTVAGALDNAPVVSGDGRVGEIAAKSSKARQRSVLVGSCKPRVPDHVGDQDRRELPVFSHGASR
jgi:hypothetical protein